eukprot:718986-Prorocentrum_lima.AAC.1
MTSSLVGSEMCIRDRLSPGDSALPAACSPGLVGFRNLHTLNINITRTVSYTHLTLPTICSV